MHLKLSVRTWQFLCVLFQDEPSQVISTADSKISLPDEQSKDLPSTEHHHDSIKDRDDKNIPRGSGSPHPIESQSDTNHATTPESVDDERHSEHSVTSNVSPSQSIGESTDMLEPKEEQKFPTSEFDNTKLEGSTNTDEPVAEEKTDVTKTEGRTSGDAEVIEMVPKSDFDRLKEQVDAMEKILEEMKQNSAAAKSGPVPQQRTGMCEVNHSFNC